MANDVSNCSDVLDSRDIIARLQELQDIKDEAENETERLHDEISDIQAQIEEADDDHIDSLTIDLIQLEDELAAIEFLTEEEDEEMRILYEVDKQGEDYAEDWKHGCTLINESYFTEYAEELAGDIGAVDRNASWPLNHIDWEEAADELKIDYTEIDFDGTTFYVR
jgi:predicted  nucleic acid-binding Zn-ribbon protein